MDFSALGRCHQPIHPVPRRSSVSSEHSSKLRFSRCFIVPAGARLFCLGMLALILTLPWNPPSAYAWSFSNDGIPAPPTVMDLDAPSASPPPLPSDGPLAAPPEVPPLRSPILLSTPLPSRSPPPISMANPPSPSTGAPGPVPTAKKSRLSGWVLFAVISAGAGLICIFACWYISFRHPLRIFISCAGVPYRSGKNFPKWLNERMKSLLKSRVEIFFDRDNLRLGVSFATTIFEELARSDVGIVVITPEYFERKWPMTELLAFVEAQKNDPRERDRIIPVFYGLTPFELKVHLDEGTWGYSWEKMAEGPHPIEVEKCREAVTWLCNVRGISYNSHNGDKDKLYIDTICKEVARIFRKERGVASNFCSMTAVVERVNAMICIDTEKRRRRANQSARKEIGVMIYINKLLRLLFAFSGLLIILFSVILDNSFNDQPVRFTAFAILAPVMIFLGFLASGWFPQIPLWFIAFVKQRGFLQHVVPCSPWHDNVVTDYCGKICTLEPLEQDEGTRLLEFPTSVRNFLYGDRFPLQKTTHTTYSHSMLDSDIQDCQAATSSLEIQGQDIQEVSTLNQDLKTSSFPDQAFVSEFLDRPRVVTATDQVPSPKLQDTPSRVEDTVVEIDHCPLLYVLGNEQAPMLEFEGPKLNGFPLKVQAFKNTSTRDLTFDLYCTFRNKKTRRMNLTTERLSNLVQNMYQWVEMPYPIVVDESSAILHCMAIQDILWAFTEGVYTINSTAVEHRYLAGTEKDESVRNALVTVTAILISIIPLVWDKKSYWFLLFLIFVAVYVLWTKYTPYYFRSLVCLNYIKHEGFSKLYKSKSSFIWCNEFRKERVINPESFWIDQDCANKHSDADSCFDTGELIILPGNPFRGQSFTIACQGWPEHDPKKQHDYELKVDFDTFKPGDTCYTGVQLSFSENGDPLGTRKYMSVEIQRLQLIEKLFYCYSNPSFGGYVEAIRPCSWSQAYLGNCRRFLENCTKIAESTLPIPWEAATKSDSRFIIGVPF